MATEITVVRAYLTEGDKLLAKILSYLHDELRVKGVTVFRAISGFGKSGAIHSSHLITMSMDLPLVVEFFDYPEQAQEAIIWLTALLNNEHIISWKANLN